MANGRDEKVIPFPADIDAEADVIGCLLFNPGNASRVADMLLPDDFYSDTHREIYDAAMALYHQHRECNGMNVTFELRNRGTLDQVGGQQAIEAFSWREGISQPIEVYAEQVKKEGVWRKLAYFGMSLYQEARARKQDLLEDAEAQLYQIALGATSNTLPDDSEKVFSEYLAILEDRQYKYEHGIATGIPTGFPDLDQIIGGLQPGEQVILGARPSIGKSSIALNIARNVLMQMPGRRVAFFSLEMKKHALAQRMLAMEVPMDQSYLRDGSLDHAQFESVRDAARKLSQVDLRIDDASMTIGQIRTVARRLHGIKPLNLIVVDYLQLVRPSNSGRRQETRAEEVDKISRDLKALAMELDVPVLALAQIKREVEQRQNKEPMMSDLKESGGIEQNADIVMFLHVAEEEMEKRMQALPFLVDTIVQKNRNGRLGSAKLEFKPRSTRFVPVDPTRVGSQEED